MIKAALDKATQKGAYSLDETFAIATSFQSLVNTLNKLEEIANLHKECNNNVKSKELEKSN